MTKQQKVNELLENNEFLCAQVSHLIRRPQTSTDGFRRAEAEIKELTGIIRRNMTVVRELSEEIALEESADW